MLVNALIIEGIEFYIVDDIDSGYMCWDVENDFKPSATIPIETWEDEEKRIDMINKVIQEQKWRIKIRTEF